MLVARKAGRGYDNVLVARAHGRRGYDDMLARRPAAGGKQGGAKRALGAKLVSGCGEDACAIGT